MATNKTTPSSEEPVAESAEVIEDAVQESAEDTDAPDAPELEEMPADELPAESADTDADEESNGAGDAETAAEETDDEDEADEPAPVATVPSFGLLFQAPEPVAPRRATRRAPEPEVEADSDNDDTESDEGTDSSESREDSADEQQGQPRRRRRRGGRGRNRSDGGADESTDGDDESGSDDTDDSSDEQQGSRKRRGRGRGQGGSGQGEETTDDSSDGSEGEDQDGSTGDDNGDGAQDSEGGSSRRRRRRRRGSGGGGNDGQDDPPGTVTKVREGRSGRDEPQAVKGSTRLEAKKQRRREGREAGRRRTIITEAEFLARRESVERVMVVRSTDERTQIGVLEDDVLVEHYVSRETTSTMVGNVYLGRVQNVLPSMEAAFVDIGKGRNAVLYAGEVNWDAHGVGNGQARRIENALSSGDTVLVQVTKDPIGHKGARLTSQISLPGRYLVYVPEGSMTGISRKLPDKERARLKSILKEVVPDSAGVIVRTAAEGASEDELKKDVERLTKAWERISGKVESKKGKKGGAPTLLHAEPDMTVRVSRDIFNEDFATMVVSGESAWREIKGYVDDVAPDLSERLTRWTGEGDVFAEHRIDEQIAKAMDRKVWLPSGGSLVIDRTEAMTVVDVNTGKFVGSGGNLEETVTKNNIEAAEEIVRQLRLRDIGGIIVIDFIDMVLEANRDLVVRRLLECLGRDRTKHQVAEVTSLGLVQMTRKRVGSGLIEVFSEECECCQGRGIHISSEPVDNGNGGGQKDDSSGSRRGRGRGRGAKGEDASSSKTAERTEPQTDKNGRTAAQIAAAAHAAAIKNIAGEPAEDDVAELALAATSDDESDAAASATDAADGTAPEPQPDPEPVAAPEPEPEPAPEPEPEAPKRRRGGRRAASSGAPVTLQAVDLTAAPTTSAPLTTVAGETGAAEQADDAGTPPSPEPTAPTTPPRRKRKRVTSEAGPPTATETE